ncbi:hypothetical protein HUU42_05570 [bacterium]|nr:hypothetical protein [bacterium]
MNGQPTKSADSEKPVQEKKYEDELGAYIHLEIEEQQKPEGEFEKIVPESLRQKGFWKRLHLRRKIIVSRTAEFFMDWKKMVVVWIILLAVVVLGLYLEWDKEIVGGTLLLVGIVSSAFSWLGAGILSVIGLVPFIGPMLVTILSSSVLWIINGLGYFVSVIAIKAGHGKAVLNYRLLVIVFLSGLVTGYVIAKIVH